MTPARTRPRHALPCLAAVAALTLTVPAFGDERDDRIRDLERLVREQAAEQTRMREELEALKRDAPAATTDRGALRDAVEELLRSEPDILTRAARPSGTVGGEARLDLGGYFSTRYFNSELPGEKPSFQDMRFVLLTRAQVSRAVRFAGELEFEHGGVSDEADGEVKVEYAQVVLGESEHFALKAGSLLQPWGRFNSQHDDPLNELSSRPTVSRLVHGTVYAAPGVGIEGSFTPSECASINYDLTLTNGLANDFTSGDGIRDARTLWEDDENHDKTVAGRIGVVPSVGFLDALDLGGSFLYGKLGEKADDDMRGWGLDLSGRTGPIEFRGEWAHLGVDRQDGSGPPIDAAGNLGPIRGMQGWYAQALYRFTDPWVRSLPFADKSASVAVLVRRDSVDTNDRVIGAAPEDDENAWSFGINYRPSTKTVIKFEWRFAESSFEGEEGSDRDLIAVEFATYF